MAAIRLTEDPPLPPLRAVSYAVACTSSIRRRSADPTAPLLPTPGRTALDLRGAPLSRHEATVRSEPSDVLREARRLDIDTRRSHHPIQTARLRELRLSESQLHANLADIRRQFAEVRAALAGHSDSSRTE